MLQDSTIKDLAKKSNKSEAQVILNWHIKNEHIVFPKCTHKEHLEQNREIFNFKLEEGDYTKINGLNKDARFYDRIPDENYKNIPYWL